MRVLRVKAVEGGMARLTMDGFTVRAQLPYGHIEMEIADKVDWQRSLYVWDYLTGDDLARDVSEPDEERDHIYSGLAGVTGRVERMLKRGEIAAAHVMRRNGRIDENYPIWLEYPNGEMREIGPM